MAGRLFSALSRVASWQAVGGQGFGRFGFAQRGLARRGFIRRGFSQIWALWRDFMGDSAYEKYLAHHRRHHPGQPPLPEREFWRQRARFQEENVSTGCC